MKQQINEIHRMQQLAGILKENKTKPEVGKEYTWSLDINQGPNAGKILSYDTEYVGDDGYNLIFKVTKIHTPGLDDSLKIGKNTRTGLGAFYRYAKLK